MCVCMCVCACVCACVCVCMCVCACVCVCQCAMSVCVCVKIAACWHVCVECVFAHLPHPTHLPIWLWEQVCLIVHVIFGVGIQILKHPWQSMAGGATCNHGQHRAVCQRLMEYSAIGRTYKVGEGREVAFCWALVNGEIMGNPITLHKTTSEFQ